MQLPHLLLLLSPAEPLKCGSRHRHEAWPRDTPANTVKGRVYWRIRGPLLVSASYFCVPPLGCYHWPCQVVPWSLVFVERALTAQLIGGATSVRLGYGLSAAWVRLGYGLVTVWVRFGVRLGYGSGYGLVTVWVRLFPYLGTVYIELGPYLGSVISVLGSHLDHRPKYGSLPSV